MPRPADGGVSILDGEGRLRGAVEAGVALEALAEAVLAVADAAVRARRDELVVARRRRRELDELDVARVLVAVAVRVGEGRAVPVDLGVELDAVLVLRRRVGGGGLLRLPDLGDGEHVARVRRDRGGGD